MLASNKISIKNLLFHIIFKFHRNVDNLMPSNIRSMQLVDQLKSRILLYFMIL
jgi:hypothetical protein